MLGCVTWAGVEDGSDPGAAVVDTGFVLRKPAVLLHPASKRVPQKKKM